MVTVWRRASRCEGGACVEVREDGDRIDIRDSKDPAGPILSFTRCEWEAFIAAVNAGEFK